MKFRDMDGIDWLIAALVFSIVFSTVFGMAYGAYSAIVDDNRQWDCKRAGGTVVHGDSHGDWNCSGIHPEVLK